MTATIDSETIRSVGAILNDRGRPLTDRFRALFTLKNLGGHEAVGCIAACFDDSSALLKHELAYCLGQMQDRTAIPTLIRVLKDVAQEAMVRHEAGEALGAIGSDDVQGILGEYVNDPIPEVAETCQLALKRIKWLQTEEGRHPHSSEHIPYTSVDPAPPCRTVDTPSLRATLLDEQADLFTRYRAMFGLRNRSDAEAVLALAEGLKCRSALFRHEIAYVLGQVQHPAAIAQLSASLRDASETAMVRHECAEALGAIATPECMAILLDFSCDSELVVRQSCQVALDMSEYENSDQFEYADGLARVSTEGCVRVSDEGHGENMADLAAVQGAMSS